MISSLFHDHDHDHDYADGDDHYSGDHHDHNHDHDNADGDNHDTHYDIIIDNGAFQLKVIILP